MLHGPKNTSPMAAAPMIMQPMIIAVVAVESEAVAVFTGSKAVVVGSVYTAVEVCGASGAASQPTATVRINRAKIASAIRLFMSSPFCLGTALCYQGSNSMNSSVRIPE
ncbi:hypothetical protein [Nocardia sp. NBC_00403]|uniref:hypothetical protein n=1 Tax=Nocardia sp. NBC_00403 TaxID=2975990 RepID=UPI002E1C8511